MFVSLLDLLVRCVCEFAVFVCKYIYIYKGVFVSSVCFCVNMYIYSGGLDGIHIYVSHLMKCICTYLIIYIYVYIYIYMRICVYTYTCKYIFIYIERETCIRIPSDEMHISVFHHL